MPTVRKNGAASQNAAGLARYSVAENSIPEELHPKLQTFMVKIHDHLKKHAPENVDAVVAYTKASWERPVSEVTLYTVGKVEQRHDLLFEVAEKLAGFYVEDILEKVTPITCEQWKEWVEKEGVIYRHIKGRGIAVYDRAEALQAA